MRVRGRDRGYAGGFGGVIQIQILEISRAVGTGLEDFVSHRSLSVTDQM